MNTASWDLVLEIAAMWNVCKNGEMMFHVTGGTKFSKRRKDHTVLSKWKEKSNTIHNFLGFKNFKSRLDMIWDIPRSSEHAVYWRAKSSWDTVKSMVLLASISPKAKVYCCSKDLALDILVLGMDAVLAPLGMLLTASCSLYTLDSRVKHLWLVLRVELSTISPFWRQL